MPQSHTCAICLEGVAPGGHAHATPCRHVFHAACMGGWRGHGGHRCPLCNADLPPPAPRAGGAGAGAGPWGAARRKVCGTCRALGCARAALCLLGPLGPLLLFYAVLYLGKAGLWLMLLDKPRVGDHNATGAGNATRARDTVRWSPGSVHFSQIFMGMVVLLMTQDHARKAAHAQDI